MARRRVIAAGLQHSLAVDPDGDVWAWGGNDSGQLGNGTYEGNATPVQLPGLTGLVAVTTHTLHSLALRADGSVWAWGNNTFGALGLGMIGQQLTPTQVPGLSDVVDLSAGETHSLAVRADGTVWAWGTNDKGQLGALPDSTYYTPTQVPGISDVVAVSAGSSFSLALRQDGSVWAWGLNNTQQLGVDNTDIDVRAEPAPIPGLTKVVSLSAGVYHALAARQDGSVWTWGYVNELGGTYYPPFGTTPIQVPGLSDAVAVTAGTSVSTVSSLALRRDGTVWAWGDNTSGQLGDGTMNYQSNPVQVVGMKHAVAVTMGSSHTLALRWDGTFWAWGDNDNGQLGDGTTTQRNTALQVPGLTSLKAVPTPAPAWGAH
ncbi:RCC1 domain-containing protein [Archangium minus]|uniref:RCC1 domain-containing protein n=1 Tax=Archangium minus TaxID=83450 RepID=UPI0037BFD0B7